MKVAIPVNRPLEKENYRVSSHFGKAFGFLIVDTQRGEKRFVENPRNSLKLKHGVGKLIAQLFEREGVSAVLLKEIGKGAFRHLKEKGIEIYLLSKEVKEIDSALEMFREGNLPLLDAPNEEETH
ncbi:MAG TPA: dinitrogenase iron-molybdenum cofactor biosynthesis protein [Aquifex aeolicus]|uniref:Dinitrogenase iron-molybdenum cofactor biosynthesis protein n=1 Tax=Aquifex aeolicus TaxID=63363 RepID=A0A9D0YQH2_AQUAO|nr:dinitrogenase iron-molybdenum cofactor biosynthesis protein [Aquificales bacterium]HIP98911.1 dinitrogenase iron-molybdenum cofactor biosynthesis protein [Aquifex aeolicus]HIQ26810.1 dinitrogenase iron-molybdenum cofactor biosynthesis protein [Aquifex aeolicus]